MTDTRDLLTVTEAALALNASNQTVRNWIRSERLGGIRIGHRFLIPRGNVERMSGGVSAPVGEGPRALDSDDAPVRLLRARAVDAETIDALLGE
jgi:excisionase family DNA binding protein